MNRCLTLIPRHFSRWLFLTLLGASALSLNTGVAQTGVREFPAAARRGTLVVTKPPEVLINGAAARLSPGARILGVNNTLVLSASLVGQSVLVNYRRDAHGLIHELWILSAAEAQEKRVGMEPLRNYLFGSDADKPKTDDGNTPFDQLPKYPKQ